MNAIDWFTTPVPRYFATCPDAGFTNIVADQHRRDPRTSDGVQLVATIEAVTLDREVDDIRHRVAVTNDRDGHPLIGYQPDLDVLLAKITSWTTPITPPCEGWPIRASIPITTWMFIYNATHADVATHVADGLRLLNRLPHNSSHVRIGDNPYHELGLAAILDHDGLDHRIDDQRLAS